MKLSTTNQNQSLSVIPTQEILFIDKGVYDYQSLVNGVKPGIAVVILDSKRDGIEQITEVLAQNSFTKIHIVSHGSPGCLYLGNSELNLDNLNNYAQQLKNWFTNQEAEPQAMGSHPEHGNQKPLSLSHSLPPSLSHSLLLYGCNVAAGDAGEEFIEKLHQLTAANIAASTTAIGNAQRGGNWQLDLHKGEFLSQLAFSEEATVNYAGVLATIYVNQNIWGNNDGTSWNDAYTDLQAAIAAANSGDQIWVAQGTYKPTDTADRSISFELKDGVAIYGGFNGTETSLNQRNWRNNETILSGDIGNQGDNSDNTESVVKSVGNSSQRISNTAILDGFKVRDGNNNQGSGGGLYLEYSDATLNNLNINNNTARFGGGLYLETSNATLNNLNISNNNASLNGGGIRNFDNSNPTLNNVTISGNSASNGGGIANGDSNPQIRNSIIWDNTATSNPETDGGNNYQNSIVKDSGGSGGSWNSALGTDGGGNLDINPLFVDAANGDFRLQAASPAINAGDNNLLPADTYDLDGDGDTSEKIPFDLDGNARTLNATVDMGAYEKFVFAVDEDAAAPTAAVGTLVSDLFEIGIAITAADTTNGSWFYSIDNGSNWNLLGAVSDNNGRLLAADTNTRIYFQPNANYNGTINDAITFRDWDESSGSNGGIADTTINGGGTAFSSVTQTTLVIVNSINDAPSFTGDAILAAVDEAAANPAGETIANLFNGKFDDIDTGASLSGVAVVGNSVTNEGKWQYSTDSSTWNDIVGVNDSTNAFALSENTKIRFLPGGSFNGTPPSLTVRALDDSYSGRFATTIDVTTNGGESAISASTNTISTTVNPFAAVIYVDSSATGDNNGGSWDNAFTDLQSALANGNSGDEIWVAQGIYKPTNTTDRSISFELKDGVAIYGGFAGGETSLNQRDFQNNITILSGDIGTSGANTDNSYNVVKFSNDSGTTTLDGFTIQEGNSNDDGGGVWNRGNLTLRNSVVKNNEAADDGGGIRNDGNLTIINSTVADNVSNGDSQTSGGGGLINTIGATATIINSTFSANEARFDINTGNGGNGGAIRNDSILDLINSTLSGNNAASPIGGGGAIANSVGTVTIKNSTITNNTAAGIGAGVSTASGVTVSNSIIAGNVDNKDVAAVSISGNNGSFTSGGNNLIGNGEGTSFTNEANGDIVGTSANPINPLLGTLEDNGGLTQTHALLNGSPAINAGSNSSIAEDTFDLDGNSNTTENLPFEQRGVGFERILDNTVDIGAYEIVSVVEVNATTTDGTYKTGDTVDITVKFAKLVSFNTQDGLPQLTLETGDTDRVAIYKNGNNSDTLTFSYTVQAGDESLDLDYISKTALQYSGGTIKDSNGNEVDLTLPNKGETDSLSDNKDIVIDAIAPRVTLNSTAPQTVNGKFTVTATFTEAVTGFEIDDITLNNAAISNFTGSGANYSFEVTPQATGSVTVDINADVAIDSATNNNTNATQLTREADLIPPEVVSITQEAQTIRDSTSSFRLTVKYSEEMDVSVNPDITFPTENPNNTISLASGSWNDNKTYIATYTVTDANEELADIDVKVENALDKVGNTQDAFTLPDLFSIDNKNPGVTLTSTAPATVNGKFNVTATFTEAVTNFDSSDITLNNATISNFTGSGNNYTFDVTPTATGSVTVDINSAVAQDSATNNNIAAIQLSREADLTLPTVSNIIASTSTISDSTTSFTLTVEYSEEMDVSVNPDITFPTENPNNTISFNGGSWNSDNKTYVATYSVNDGDEELADIDVKVEKAVDKVGNIQDASVLENLFSIENQNPAVTLTSTAAATVNSTFNVTAEFSELVNDFDINDITLTNATASNFVENFTIYSFDVTPQATGSVTIDINADVATDIAGNNNTFATQLTTEADLNSPTVVNITPSTPTISDATTTFTLTVEYSEEMDTSVNPVITIGDTQNTITSPSGSWSDNKTYIATYTVSDVEEELADIDVTVENALDKVGNIQDAFTANDVLSIDNKNPAVTLTSTAPETVNGKFTVTATFTESVTNFDSSDILLNNATIDNFTGSGNNYSFEVTPQATGSVTVDINSAVAQDSATNNNIPATQLTREADLTLPTVNSITASTSTIIDSTTSFTLTVEYSEEMDVSVNPDISFPTENPNNTISLASGSWNSDNKTYVATYSVTDAEEELADIDVEVENGKDKAGNTQDAFASPDLFSIDNQNPTVSNIIASTSTISDSTTTFTLTVEYSQEMDTLVNPVITIGDTQNTITSPTGSWSDNKTYIATYTVTDANEELSNIDVTVENALDKAGNIQTVFTLPDLFSIDNQNPAVTLTSTASETVNGKFTVTATFTESVTNFEINDITLNNATVDNFNGSGANYSFDVTPTATGSVTVDINSAVAQDNATNNNIAATQLTREADLTSPEVVSITPEAQTISDSTTTFTLTVEYSEEMDISQNPDITIENTQNTITLTGGSWNSDSKTYVATYSVTDAEEEIADIDVKVENAKDKVGNIQQPSTLPSVFSIDNKNPDAPSITDFIQDTNTTGDGITGDNTLIINGSAEANSEIEIFQNGRFIDTTNANDSGNWSFDYTNTTLEDNTYTFSAIAKDAAGNASDTSTPFIITVDAVNDAPILDNTGDMTVDDISEDGDDSNNQGTLIKDIISSGGGDKITDINIDALEGIAVTSVDNSNGNWQYSIDGSSWSDFGSVDDTTARLLAADDSTKIRFVPNPDYEGEVNITFRAWDITSGSNGNIGDATDNGGNTAFSSQTETAVITVNPVNDKPTLGNNTITVLEGGSVTLSNTDISATDVDNDDTTLSFTVSNLQYGNFEVNQVAQNSFTQKQITDGLVKFIHDGSENQPSYDIEVSDGILTDNSSATVTFTNVNDAPKLQNNALTISEGGSVTLSNTDISATDVDNNDVDFTFTISNLQNGEFQVNQVVSTSFTQQQITDGLVKFIHDGSENQPSYDLEVSDGSLKDSGSVTVTFTNVNDAPKLENNALTIDESGSVTFSSANLSVIDVDNNDVDLTFTISNLQNGEFQVNQVVATSFTQQQITDGLVKFIHDGSENQPSYDIEVSDGSLKDSGSANISFTNVNDAPKLENNALTIDESGSVTFSSANLSATDVDNNDVDLTFTISNLQNGEFQVNQVVSTSFTQQQITDGLVKFIHDGSENQPSYDIEVSDGEKSSDKSSVTVSFTNTNDAPTLKNEILKIEATQDTEFNFTLPEDTFADSDVGDTLTYKATLDDDSQLPSWLSFTNGAFTGTPTSDNLGEINIKVTATDEEGESVSDTFTLLVEKPNIPPVVDDATFSIQENSEENTVVGIVTASDSDNEALKFALAAGNLDLDEDAKLAFAINPDTGEITVNDKDDIDFETTPQFNLEVTATDTGGLNNSADITINLTDVATAQFDVNSSQNGILSLNGGDKTNIKFTLANIDASVVNEIAVFEVDENGNIDGNAPGSDGFIKAALSQSQIIFSAISNLPNGFTTENIQRVLEVNSDARLEFLSISNGTIDTALAEIESTGNTNLSIEFSTSDNLALNNLNAEGFTLELASSIQVNAALTQENTVQGTQLQTQKELIDLRDTTISTAVSVEVYREAAFDNLIGLYKVTDVNGGIDTDGDGIADINVGDAGYKNAALTNRITGLDLLSTENQTTTTIEGNLESGSILATFMIADGTLDEAINNNAEVYFSFLGANSDKTDHIRLLSENTFGFEDMVNGGDQDFNDVIMKVNFLNG